MCAYCGQPLRFRDVHVDHIVPEYLANHSTDYEDVRANLGLSQDFDLQSYANLVPSCGHCNMRKLGSILPNTSIYLAVAKRNERRVIDLRDKINKDIRADKLRVVISAALTTGAISREQVAPMIAEPHLHTYASGTVLDLLLPDLLHDMSDDDYQALLDIQAISPPFEVGLILEGGERELVLTLREYRDKSALGYFPLTQADMNNAYRYFEMPLRVLSILRQATLADRSFIREPYVGLADIALLPASLLYSMGEICNEPTQTGQMTIRDLVVSGEANLVDTGSHHVAIDWQSFRTFMFELMRTDVDDDGIEEMLINVSGRPMPNGTLRVGRLAMLSRKSPTDPFKELEWNGRQPNPASQTKTC